MSPPPLGLLNDGYSRRKFLRAAVIGTAGVAGAAGVAGVVLSQRGGAAPTLTHIFDVGNPGVSGNDPYTFTFEPTTQDQNLTSIGKKGPSEPGGPYNLEGAYFAVLAIYLTAGQYTVSLSESLDGTTFSPITSSSTPFDFQGGGNPVLINFTTSTLNDGPYAKTTGTQIADGSSFSVPFDTTSDGAGNILVFTHLNFSGTAPASGTHYPVYFQYVVTPTSPAGSPITVPFTLQVYPDS